jgi:MinD superfamily P-loop ATPase
MREIVIISGKGGTGKTSVTASFARLAGHRSVVADCDVDAADLHLLLAPDFGRPESFYSGQTAQIDREQCIRCNKCVKACRFNAIYRENDDFIVDGIKCEGCAYCEKICPSQAITMLDALSGETYISTTRLNTTMVHAELAIAAENSGKLVTRVKTLARDQAREREKDYLIVDGSPGIGCPVTASVTGADYGVVVTEPTLSGWHDLKRAWELIAHFSLPTGVIINKSDLNPEVTGQIKDFAAEKSMDLLAEIPYSEAFVEAMTRARTVVEYNAGLGRLIRQAWDGVLSREE